MIVYVVTVQGHFIEVTKSKKEAERIKMNYYMGGHDNVTVTPKEV